MPVDSTVTAIPLMTYRKSGFDPGIGIDSHRQSLLPRAARASGAVQEPSAASATSTVVILRTRFTARR
jgi:hypothetical protein